MLILTGKPNETFHLVLTEDMPAGTEVKVMVLENTRSNAARLGFDAPHNVSVLRDAMYNQMKSSNQVMRIRPGTTTLVK